jgi:uncharacterized protein (DUF1330 family)
MSVTLCVLLWAREGRDADLTRYEDQVLGLVGDHDGRVLQRVQTVDPGDQPSEVQILQFGSAAALEEYMQDHRRAALAGQRDAAIARTDVLPVRLLS